MTRPGIKLTLVLLAIILILPFKGFCQEINSRLSKPVAGFLDPVYGVDQRLISGSFYYGPRRGSISGTAFFIDESWKKGSVTIGKLSYHDLDLKYDIEKNKIVLKFANIQGSVVHISLKKDNINNFVMNGRLFVPFPGTNKFDTAKFCEVIVSGEINYIILKTKFLTLLTGGVSDYEYKEYIRQFLYINNQLIPFKTRRVIYNLYPEYKQELKRYLRSQGLDPMKNRIRDREAMVKYCNQLISDQN
jgi:hypothetical protein